MYNKEEYFPGKGCTCMAWDAGECGCDVDWRSVREVELEEQVETLTRERDELQAYADKLAQGLPCLPKDVEILRDANTKFAEENVVLKSKIREMGNED